jgi:hypothetical protein
LSRRPTLTKLGLRCSPLDRDEATLIWLALCNIPSLQSLVLVDGTLGSAELAELAPALYRNTPTKVLDISENILNDMESAEILRNIIRNNKIMTTLDFSGNGLGQRTGAVDCFAVGLGSNSTLLKLNISRCCLKDYDIPTLAQTLGSWNTTLEKLALGYKYITSTGVGVLLETME